MAEERCLEEILREIWETYARRAVIDIADKGRATQALPVFFACPNCALLYRAIQVGRPKVKAGRMDCLDCRERVHQWPGGFYDFIDWQPVRAVV